MTFSTTNQPANNGRRKGIKNKRSAFSDEITAETPVQLGNALSEGSPWAIQEVLKQTHLALKAITPSDSVDGQLLALKVDVAKVMANVNADQEIGRQRMKAFDLFDYK
jgi:hypothetical protein